MKVTEPEEAGQYTVLYEATIQQAVGGASGLMKRLVEHTRTALRELEANSGDRRERDDVTHSRRLLNQFEDKLCERFTEELLTAFARMASVERAAPAAVQPLHFDQLANMDDAAIEQKLAKARAQHAVQLSADSALEELNRLICTMLGLGVVRLEHNPLRPVVYVEALTAALTHLAVPGAVRQKWILLMSGALARELELYYAQLSSQLRKRGVGSTGTLPAAPVPPLHPARRDAGMLTLDKLSRLLAGRRVDIDIAVAQRFVMDDATGHADSLPEGADAGPTAFRATVPAAFEAIQDPKQLDQVVQRLQGRAEVAAGADPATEAEAAAPLGPDQVLGQEVVAMMLDNITHDERLLGPVQRIVAALEPALLQLATVDPRFFSHKQHPARRLLHEITHRSIAFESVDSRGFSGFMEPLREAIAPLTQGEVKTAEPFDHVLTQLVGLWDEPGANERRQLAKAVKALRLAEQRSILAATIIEAVQARPDAALVPDAVLDFVCGPWAQVVAHARMSDKQRVDDPGGYARLIEEIMWSAQPHRTRKQAGMLTRVVPPLLAKLREGLATIDYPAHKTSEFFEVLMQLHQRGFKPEADAKAAVPAPVAVPREAASTRGRPLKDSTWVAPLEASASGFIDLSTDMQALPVATADSSRELELGAWVMLQAEGSWNRTQLSWISPNRTLLLFTDALGYMQTLTRRSCDQLIATGQLRIISVHLVEDALDAVARSAMRNSVDIRF